MKWLLIALLCVGCAAGTIRRPDGTSISGVAVGAASLECCESDGHLAPSTGEKDGSLNGPCTRLTGGDMSQAFAGLLGAAISAAVTYFSGGL